MSGAPRHLAAPNPVRRRWRLWTGAGLVVLLVLTVGAWVGASGGSRRDEDRRSAEPSATASRGTNAVTTTVVATTVAQAPGGGPKNLLPNASFEAGVQGSSPVGGARVERSSEATAGGSSLRILAGPSGAGPVGIAVPNAAVTKRNGRYHANAWVRPSASGATVTIGLREYRNGRPVPGSNTLGWTVERTGWRQFGAIHVASTAGSRLALEIMARDLPPGGYLEIDDVVLHLLPNQ